MSVARVDMSAALTPTTTQVAIDDPSGIGAARRRSAEHARAAGLDDESVGRAEIIATELATNLQRHATEGRLLLRSWRSGSATGTLELLAVDNGPGMADVQRCVRDGYSTGGTAGNGLGAVQRLADEFDISSQAGLGTVVLARVRSTGSRVPTAALHLGVVCLAMAGEPVCGDTWAWREEPDGGSLLVFDGLGHGHPAAEAAAAALRAFRETPAVAPTEVIEAIHGRVSGTRGGAAAVAQIDRARGLLRYAGVGNIGATLVGPERRRGLPSHNGIVGSIVGRVRGFEYEWTQGDVLVMHSDGLQSRWTMDGVAGMVHRDPAVVAALLYRDFARGRDDLTVAVCG